MKQNKVRLILLSVLLLVISVLLVWTDTTQNIEGTFKIYDRNGVLIHEVAQNKGYKRPVRLDDINQDLINAVIATEDKTFWKNSGIDTRAIGRSIAQIITTGKINSGASTITQQLVKITILNKKPVNSRYIHKIRELLISLRISEEKDKKEILESYLNEIYLGNKIYGVEAAANIYFGKTSKNLSPSESAYIAGMISSPEKYDPYNNNSKGMERQRYVLELMEKNRYITESQKELAYSTPPHFRMLENNASTNLHFVDFVKQKIEDLKIDKSRGISVKTTLDIAINSLANETANRWVKKLEIEHNITNASVVLIKNDTGEILSMLGGVNYNDNENSGAVNMAIAQRQPGSAIKPLTYALAYMSGYSPSTIIKDEESVYVTRDQTGYSPKNYDNTFHGNVSTRVALASSLNAPAVELLSTIGVETFLDQAAKMGITTFNRNEVYDLSITLGGGEVTLLELSNLYATFSREGNFIPTHFITQIISDNGTPIYRDKQIESIQTLGSKGKEVSFLITSVLSDQKARMLGFGEKNYLTLSHPAAVKTGTTTDWHDVWTIGYTPEYTLGVWVGNNDNSAMQKISGATGAAPIWYELFEEFLKNKPKSDFNIPADINKDWFCRSEDTSTCTKEVEDYYIELIDSRNNNQSNFIEIISPIHNTVYELAPELVSNETVVFEIKASKDIKNAHLILNNQRLELNASRKYYWKPYKGSFVLRAQGTNADNKTIDSSEVNFEVVSYKQYIKDTGE